MLGRSMEVRQAVGRGGVMRVQMICMQFHPFGAGTERQALALSRALVQRGLEVRVATARYRALPRTAVVDGIPVERLLYAPDRRRLRRLAKFSYVLALGIYLLQRRHAFDVLHCHMASMELIPAVLVAQRSGRPVVVKIASAGPEGDVERLRTGDQPWGVLGPVSAALLAQVSAIVAPSRRIERELKEQGYGRGHYIPNGVDVRQFRPATEGERAGARQRLALPAGSLLVGCLGRLHRIKGIDVLIKAWSSSGLPRADAVLCIAGDGPEDAALRQLASDVGATASVRFLGPVESVEFLHAVDAFALASRTEGMPNALLEAMASGLACVGTEVAGAEDLLGDGESGLLVPADEVPPLATALDELLNPSVRRRLSDAARSRVEDEFSLESVARRYEDLYRRLVSAPGAGSRPASRAPRARGLSR